MLRIGVFVGCAAMLLAAMVAVVRLWGTRRTPSPVTRAMPFAERLAITTGRSAGMVAGALVAGILVIGAGGRLLMRALAATSPEAQGLVTDAEEVVGEVSVGGSLFLVLGLGSLAGLMGLAGFATLRRWLPERSVGAGLCGAAIGGGLLARPSGLLDPDNPDFEMLSPRGLAVALCVGILVLFGLAFGPVVDRLAAVWPRPSRSLRGVLAVAPFLLLLPSPPVALAVGLVVVLAAWLGPMVQANDGAPSVLSGAVGRVAVLGLAVLGGAVTIASATQVFLV